MNIKFWLKQIFIILLPFVYVGRNIKKTGKNNFYSIIIIILSFILFCGFWNNIFSDEIVKVNYNEKLHKKLTKANNKIDKLSNDLDNLKSQKDNLQKKIKQKPKKKIKKIKETLSQKQAVKAAQNYIDVMAFSRQGLIKQLKYEGYTEKDATYAVKKIGL